MLPRRCKHQSQMAGLRELLPPNFLSSGRRQELPARNVSPAAQCANRSVSLFLRALSRQNRQAKTPPHRRISANPSPEKMVPRETLLSPAIRALIAPPFVDFHRHEAAQFPTSPPSPCE